MLQRMYQAGEKHNDLIKNCSLVEQTTLTGKLAGIETFKHGFYAFKHSSLYLI